MQLTFRHSLRLATLAVCLLTAGCSMNELRGPGYTDDQWAKRLRKPDPQTNGSFGFSNKARDIESNLGVD